MTRRTLAEKIEDAISAIPASNPMVLSLRQRTLGDLLDRDVLRKIAQIAATCANGENAPDTER